MADKGHKEIIIWIPMGGGIGGYSLIFSQYKIFDFFLPYSQPNVYPTYFPFVRDNPTHYFRLVG